MASHTNKSVSARQSYITSLSTSSSCRKVATARDRFHDDETSVGYSQLLPSTKYWSPSYASYSHEYANNDDGYSGYNDYPGSEDEDLRIDLSSANYELNHAGNLRSNPVRRHSSRSSSAPMRRTVTKNKSMTTPSSPTTGTTVRELSEKISRTSFENASHDADAWKLWLEEKHKRLHEEKEKKRLEEEAKLEEERNKEAERTRRLQLSRLKRQEWLAKKLKDEIEEKMKEERKLARKEEEKMREKEEKQAKNEERVKEWKEKKLAAEKEMKQKMKEREMIERQKNEEKAMKAQQKYEEWAKEAGSRPSRVSASLGYTGGRLIGFYDWSSYPSPSFYNPVPWQPLEIPQEKPRAKKATGAAANNRKKNNTPRGQSLKSAPAKTRGEPKVSEKRTKEPREILSPPLMWKQVMARKQ